MTETGNKEMSRRWIPETSTIRALDAVIPESIARDNFPSTSVLAPEAQGFASPVYRTILYSIANNFAGLDAVPKDKVIYYLQRETGQQLYNLIRSTKGHSAKAIAQNIFKGAIEYGDHRIIDLLLKEKAAGIDVNKQFCSVDGKKWTPIQRASALCHDQVVRVLLNHRANPNRTHFESEPLCSALDCVVLPRKNNQPWPTHADTELFCLLLKAGARLSSSSLLKLFQHSRAAYAASELTCLAISTYYRENYYEWTREGILCYAIMFLDHIHATEVIRIMIQVGADLNYRRKAKDPKDYPLTIIDSAAMRGDLEIVKILRDQNVVWTRDTLPHAIQSGNTDLVQIMLDEKEVDVHSTGWEEGITPLAVAIRCKNTTIQQQLEERGAMEKLSDPAHLSAALRAASDVIDIDFIERLIRLWTRCEAN